MTNKLTTLERVKLESLLEQEIKFNKRLSKQYATTSNGLEMCCRYEIEIYESIAKKLNLNLKIED